MNFVSLLNHSMNQATAVCKAKWCGTGREKQANTQLDTLKARLKEGVESGEPEEWDRKAFLKMIKARMRHKKGRR